MKKLLVLTSIMAMATSAVAGFQDNTAPATQKVASVNSVAKAQKAKDNTPFSMSGYIESRIDDDKFWFRDTKGGRIIIEVEDHAWNGLTVNPKMKVRIAGKVDYDDGKITLDVNRISK